MGSLGELRFLCELLIFAGIYHSLFWRFHSKMDLCSTLMPGRFHRVSVNAHQRGSPSRHMMVKSPRLTLTLTSKVVSSLEVLTKWSRYGTLWMIKKLANEMLALLHHGILVLYVFLNINRKT